jgi:hypothetical protein
MGQDEQAIGDLSMTVAVTVVGGLGDLFEMPHGDIVELNGFQRHEDIPCAVWVE